MYDYCRARCATFLGFQNTSLPMASLCPNCSNETIPSQCLLSVNQRVGVYGGLVAGTIVINFATIILLSVFCVNASRVLHNRMFGSILRAPIRFFDTNPIGELYQLISSPLLHSLTMCSIV